MLELAHLRNRLVVGKFDEHEQILLNKIKKKLERSDSPFSKLIRKVLENCVADLKLKDFKSATTEIQLVHNFPVSQNEYRSWDEDHFYQIELLSYIEDVNSTNRIKQLIRGLAEIEKFFQSQASRMNTDFLHPCPTWQPSIDGIVAGATV